MRDKYFAGKPLSTMEYLLPILLMLAVATLVVLLCQRLRIPTSLGYLLVGVILGPFTVGPTIHVPEMTTLAEFGVVFLLFTVGLNFTLQQIHSLRHQVLGPGAGQVALTTLVIALVCWFAGMPGAAAFVFGAAFAQSSTTIMASLLAEQGEESSRHGRLGLSMSVFQDVTAVPFLVIIPVLGVAVSMDVLATALAWTMAKAAFAMVILIMAGRWFLRPLFNLVTERRSAEVFTLAVLLVALLAAWITNSLGLSLAFGGFLAGMMLGETEFRHQVESSIRPFRDVLLGLFFIGIGMRFDPVSVLPVLHWSLLGACGILLSKFIITSFLLRLQGQENRIALRSGLLLCVGGEFGLALIAIAIDAAVLEAALGQVAISSVLLSLVVGALVIRFNGPIASRLSKAPQSVKDELPDLQDAIVQPVLIAGYGRVGHTVAVLLHASGIPFIAFDVDRQRVAFGRSEGHQVYYGDMSDPGFLSAIGASRASLMVLTLDDAQKAWLIVSHMHRMCPDVRVIARARDIQNSKLLLTAGASQAQPEAIEASLNLAISALETLHVPTDNITRVVQEARERGYRAVLEKSHK
jgi:monovalent cation:H+ antiporter-2, CPA2 family